MLTNFRESLNRALKEHYAIAHFNVMNLEWAKSILEVANETKTPTIIALTDAVSTYFGGYSVCKDLVESLVRNLGVTVPITLHLDHGSYEGCLKCIECGFNSIMFDGSKLPIEENVKKTTELVKLAHEKNMTVEAEVGSIGGVEDGIVGKGEIANPEDCIKLANIGIDALACGIGNIHGKYPENWEGLSFETLSNIREKIPNLPLVLHGGSGIPEEQIKKAISLGISKINVNTELHLSFAEALRKYIEDKKDLIDKGYDIRNITKDSIANIKQTIKTKMELFGSLSKG